jgi:hypothetical protein
MPSRLEVFKKAGAKPGATIVFTHVRLDADLRLSIQIV